MLKISYKIKGLHLIESWFASKVPMGKISLLRLCCYRDSRVDINIFGLKKEKKYTLINDLTQEEVDIFSDFKPNVRNEIRKHTKIDNFLHHSGYKSKRVFLEFYKKFAEAKGLTPIKEHSIDKYGDNLFYIQGSLDGVLTNIQVYIVDKESGTVRLLHSISKLYERDSGMGGFSPKEEDAKSIVSKFCKKSNRQRETRIGWINRYLHWHTMLHFKDKGLKLLIGVDIVMI